MTDDDANLEHWLQGWAKWMRWKAGVGPQGYARCASGFRDTRTNYMVAEDDSEAYWDRHAVPTIIRAIDSAIDSLDDHHRRVIWWKYGLTTQEPTAAPAVFTLAFCRVKKLVLQRVAIAT